MRRQWVRGVKEPVEGAPLAQWGIHMQFSAEPITRTYPDGDSGLLCRTVAHCDLAHDARRIHVHMHSEADYWDVDSAMKFVQNERDHGRVTEASEPFDVVLEKLVRACREPECESFGGWHGEHEKHAVCDLSKSDWRVRLVLDSDGWRPDVSLWTRIRTPETLASFTSDLTWLAVEARRLNTKELQAS